MFNTTQLVAVFPATEVVTASTRDRNGEKELTVLFRTQPRFMTRVYELVGSLVTIPTIADDEVYVVIDQRLHLSIAGTSG